LLLDGGESLPAVTDLLGHAKTSKTANVYAHAVRGSQRRIAATMDNLLSGTDANS
jgi:integrase